MQAARGKVKDIILFGMSIFLRILTRREEF